MEETKTHQRAYLSPENLLEPNSKDTPLSSDHERQKNAFVEKLIEIVRKTEKPFKPEGLATQSQS